MFGNLPGWSRRGVRIRRQPRGLHGQVAETDDDYLYQTNRWWHPAAARSGYAIPVDAGTYRLTLHFAEVWYQAPALRRFTVLLDGEPALVDIDLYEEHGFSQATSAVRVVRVDDGLLKIDLRSEMDYPLISALEVEPVDPR